MSEVKHTPGPWDVDGFNTTAVIAETVKEGITQSFSSYQHICDCNYGYSKPEEFLELNKANAKLIAAAPELLEACIMALDNKMNGESGSKYRLIEVVDALTAAIAKATT